MKKTVPGGTAPTVDDATRAKQILRELREIVGRVSDATAETILGDGTLEQLLASVMPAAKKGDAIHAHLMAHKRRASLLARLRHDINDASAFPIPESELFVAPTRVQWFYDGLTFLEGSTPYAGVVGLLRDGVLRYGLNVEDGKKGETLGPLAADFVSVAEAKRSFRGGEGSTDDALKRLAELRNEDDPSAWTSFLVDQPWVLGGQHTAISHVARTDEELPQVTAKRAFDSAHDVLLIEPPSTEIVGKTGKVLVSFRERWLAAERLRTFVQRQAAYLKRELAMKIVEPRFLIVAGRGLTPADRAVVRREMEMHHAAIRLITYDRLEALAARTAAFFAGRI
ncbi:MAG: hypothetical protein AAGE52_35455 [Myxococcota bacterium]